MQAEQIGMGRVPVSSDVHGLVDSIQLSKTYWFIDDRCTEQGRDVLQLLMSNLKEPESEIKIIPRYNWLKTPFLANDSQKVPDATLRPAQDAGCAGRLKILHFAGCIRQSGGALA